jgi:L-alanine-DL-glutamate epimerase-like enolase superfamily enzyme
MKIIKAESWREETPLARPYTIAAYTVSEVSLFFVRLEAEDGTVGLGSASPGTEVTGETRDDCHQALTGDLLASLEGEDLRHLGLLTRRLATELATTPGARAALDMALHDLFARRLGVPLTDFLGGRRRPLPTSVTIGILSVEETLEEAAHYVGQGFACLKVKIGLDVEVDLERLERLRERWPQIPLRVDANRGYDIKATRQIGAVVERLSLELVEQPLPVDAVEELRTLPQDLRRVLTADENLVHEADALALLREPRPYGIWNIKLMKCGGVTAALRIAAMAETAGLELMWGCMDESRISIAAALHTACACPTTRYVDLDGSLELSRDPARGGFTIEKGCLVPLEEPGLGADLL